MTLRSRRRATSLSESLEARHLLAQAFPAEFHTLPDRVGAIATADFNGDGIADVVCATDGDTTITTFFGTAGGQLRKGVEFYTGDYFQSLATGDFNGDGKIDLAAGAWSGPVRVLLGDGLGGFPIRRSLSNSVVGRSVVSVTDFNLDGKQDVVVGYAYNNAIAVFRGTGLGTFSSPTNFPQTSGIVSLAVGDFNADGRPDLAATSEYSQLQVYTNTATGTLSAPTILASNTPRVVTADLDNDGKIDLATGSGVYLGGGDGSFAQGQQFDSFYATGGVVCFDVNLDGKQDLVRNLSRVDSIAVHLGTGDGTFAPESRTGGGAGMAVADFDADGYVDLACIVSAPSGVSVVHGSSSGRLLGYRVEYFDEYLDKIQPVDIDGNGVDDLIGFSHSGRMTRLITQPDGSHQLFATQTSAGNVSEIIAADLNADGHADLVTASWSNEIWTFLGDGLGGFEPASTLTGENGAMALADLNGDGHLDLVTLNWGAYLVHLGNGDGTFAEKTSTPLEWGCTDVAVADFNGDDIPDLAVTMRGDGSVAVLLGVGDGSLARPPSSPAAQMHSSLAISIPTALWISPR